MSYHKISIAINSTIFLFGTDKEILAAEIELLHKRIKWMNVIRDNVEK